MYIVALVLYTGVSTVNVPEVVAGGVSGIALVLMVLMLVAAITGVIRIVNALAESAAAGVLGSVAKT